MLDGPVIDVLVRTGFHGAPGKLPAWITEIGSTVTRYPLGSSVAEAAVEIVNGTAPFVVFMDDLIDLSEDAFLSFFEFLLAAPTCAGATLGAKALTAIFGDFPEKDSADPSVVRLRALPPWFSILRRSALPARLDLSWNTPEFLLFDIAASAPRDKLFLRIGDERSMEAEARGWVCDVLEAEALRLADDFDRFKRKHPDATGIVPPQFEIEALGRVCNSPSLPAQAKRRDSFPKISVICPVFKPNFLTEMLDSVRCQTWQNWELTMLVDGPPEKSAERIAEILQKYAADPRIQYAFQSNQGTGPTRNALASAATGDFVLTIDDDDELTPDALEAFASAVIHNPGVAFFRGAARLIGLVSRDLKPRPRLVIADISNDIFEVTQPFMIARELLSALGGFEWDEGLRNAGEDTILFQKLDKLRLQTGIIDRVLYYRRLSTSNLTLEFKREECTRHARTLDRLTHSPDWVLLDCEDDTVDDFQRSSSIYVGPDGRMVISSTRFFQYRTFGPISDTTIDLELTSVCNAVCTFCPREEMPDKTQFLPVGVVEQLGDQLRKLKRQPDVVFCGIGESTLHPQLEAITRIISGTGAAVSMTTNGGRMTPELFKRLVCAGMYGFNFSLNAASAATHRAVMKMTHFNEVTSMIDRLVEIRRATFPWVAIHVSFVVCDQNEHEVHHFVEYWRDRGVTQIWLHPLNNRAGLMHNAARPVNLEQYARDYAGDQIVVVDVLRDRQEGDDLCKVASSFNFISADGEVRLCAMDYRRKTHYGNIAKDNLQSSHYKKLNAFLSGETQSICEGCDFMPAKACRPEKSGKLQLPIIGQDIRARAAAR